jgi:hypothetical protein
MKLRPLVLLAAIILFSSSNFHAGFPFEYFRLAEEPLIRIGLTTNAGVVTITTSDSQLVAYSPEEPQKYLATNRVTVSARAYRPPTFRTIYPGDAEHRLGK